MTAHSALVGTNLHEAFHYVQSSDPGAVGAGKYWLDTTSSPFLIKRRNAGDTGWDNVGGSGGGGGGYVYNTGDPDKPPTSANAMDDEFDDTTGMSGSTNGLNARWSWVNQGTATFTFPRPGWGTLSVPVQASDNFRMIVQNIPAAQDWEVTAKISVDLIDQGRCRGGLVLAAAGATPALLDWGVVCDATSPKMQGLRWTNPSTFNSGVAAGSNPTPNSKYLRLRHLQSTNTYYYYFSDDCVGWVLATSLADPITVTRVGLQANDHDNAGLTKLHCNWFRRTA